MFEEESANTMPAAPNRLGEPNQGSLGHITGRDPFSSSHRGTTNSITDARILELETENLRLQRLVAELLIKNQKLRKSKE